MAELYRHCIDSLQMINCVNLPFSTPAHYPKTQSLNPSGQLACNFSVILVIGGVLRFWKTRLSTLSALLTSASASTLLFSTYTELTNRIIANIKGRSITRTCFLLSIFVFTGYFNFYNFKIYRLFDIHYLWGESL